MLILTTALEAKHSNLKDSVIAELIEICSGNKEIVFQYLTGEITKHNPTINSYPQGHGDNKPKCLCISYDIIKDMVSYTYNKDVKATKLFPSNIQESDAQLHYDHIMERDGEWVEYYGDDCKSFEVIIDTKKEYGSCSLHQWENYVKK